MQHKSKTKFARHFFCFIFMLLFYSWGCTYSGCDVVSRCCICCSICNSIQLLPLLLRTCIVYSLHKALNVLNSCLFFIFPIYLLQHVCLICCLHLFSLLQFLMQKVLNACTYTYPFSRLETKCAWSGNETFNGSFVNLKVCDRQTLEIIKNIGVSIRNKNKS